MKTWMPKEGEIERNWWVVDAADKTLGRLATEIAVRLRGKHKPQFTPHADVGDFVVVINADKVNMGGKKWTEKKYYTRSRWFGSLKSKTAGEMIQTEPTFVLEEAVRGMLPKTKLGRQLIKKLKAYKGANHPHAAQKPEALNI